MLKITTFLLATFLLYNLHGNENRLLPSISFGPVKIGEGRIPIDLRNFRVYIDSPKHKLKANFIKNSVQWIRTIHNLLSPRARMAIRLGTKSSKITIKYQGVTIIPERREKYLYTQIHVSLFNPGDITIYDGKKQIGTITLHARTSKNKKENHLIDYSCSKYNLIIDGADDEYLSIGCRVERVGNIGNEKPKLIVTWTAANLRLVDGTLPPYTIFFRSSSSSKLTTVDRRGKKRTVNIKVKIPTRLHRLKTAIGLGPYTFSAKEGSRKRTPKVSPSIMLYGNLKLGGTSSIRFFDALIKQDSTFNNFGGYFAYTMVSLLDSRVDIVPLLGLQGLSFKYNKQSTTFFQAIYPQGFEVVYKHAFGMENYMLIYGTFLSPSDLKKYKNMWIRFGKKYFWELNYIDWNHANMSSTMWGISIGIPFISLF